jgi:hypothetical protein
MRLLLGTATKTRRIAASLPEVGTDRVATPLRCSRLRCRDALHASRSVASARKKRREQFTAKAPQLALLTSGRGRQTDLRWRVLPAPSVRRCLQEKRPAEAAEQWMRVTAAPQGNGCRSITTRLLRHLPRQVRAISSERHRDGTDSRWGRALSWTSSTRPTRSELGPWTRTPFAGAGWLALANETPRLDDRRA